MSKSEDEDLERIVRTIADENHFPENAEISVTRGTGKGAGYMGEIVLIKVEDQKTKRALDLIAKLSIKDETLRVSSPICEAYVNEIQAYQTVLPALQEFQQSAKVPKPFNSTAKLYGASIEEELLILENLCPSGFEMLESRQLLDSEHVKFILERCGEFHALSFALKILEPEKFHEITKGLHNVWNIGFSQRNIGGQMSKLMRTIETSLAKHGIQNEHYSNYVNNFAELMTKMVCHEETEFACFVHGDCWLNNFMFKYKSENDRGTPDEVKILDWQYCTVGSPVLDLSYILLSGTSKEILDDLDTYLTIYHKSLSQFLGYFNLDVNKVFPFHELKRQWKKYYHYGAMLGSFVFKMRSFEKVDAIDPVNFSSDDGTTFFHEMVDTKFDEKYLVEQMKILCDHINKNENGEN